MHKKVYVLANSPAIPWYVGTKGTPVLRKYRYSLPVALKAVYNDHEWLDWRFHTGSPQSYWSHETNRTFFMRSLAKKFGFTNMEQWYSVSTAEFYKHGGSGLLRHYYNASVSAAVMSCFPEHPWLPWKFSKSPVGFWSVPENQNWFLTWFAKEHKKLASIDEWYDVPASEVILAGGGGLLAEYQGSLALALKELRPQHRWEVWRFSKVPQAYWNIPHNRREYLLAVAASLGISQSPPTEWIAVMTPKLLKERFGGSSVLKKFDGGLQQLFHSAFPECDWSNMSSSSPTRR